MTTIRVVAAVIVRDGEFLLVRKRGTSAFMQVGGKLEPGEEPRAALVRECAEEIGLEVGAAALRPMGEFRSQAANEPGYALEAEVFAVDLPPGFEPTPRAELAEVVWVDPADPATPHPIAPLSLDLLALAGTGSLGAARLVVTGARGRPRGDAPGGARGLHAQPGTSPP